MRLKPLFGRLIFSLLTLLIMNSCGVNSNLMFKEAKGEEGIAVNSDSIPLKPTEQYRIAVDDKISFTLATNHGTDIIEGLSGVSGDAGGSKQKYEYLVKENGEAEFPVIGNVKVDSLTIAQCEDTLEKLYSAEYKDPFVQVEITNKRAIVFPGNGSDAKVVPLNNANTTLMEVIALAGGITDRGKANSIKIMRRVNGERKVYRVDLSTMEGLKFTDMVIQSNDYIYVEPTPELAKEVRNEIVPVVSLFSSALVIFAAILSMK